MIRDLREQRIERLVQDLEPRDLGVAQVDDHAGAVGGVDSRLTQASRSRIGFSLGLAAFCASDMGASFGLILPSVNLAVTIGHAKRL